MTDAPASINSRREPTPQEFVEMRDSPQFATVAFFVWYVLYVLAAVFAPDFMAIELGGGWNVGLIFGLAQFLTTFIITYIYVNYANKNIEPQAAAIRQELEG